MFPVSLRVLNIWLPVGKTAWEGLGGMTCKKRCLSGGGSKFELPSTIISLCVFLVCGLERELSVTAPAPDLFAAMFLTMVVIESYPLEL